MFERFTDRARKVMALSKQEAIRLNHEQIDTVHILLGIVKEGSGAASSVLKDLNVDLRKVRLELEKFIQPGPEKDILGKLPQTEQAKKMVALAIDEARANHDNYVGTEHLLLGLCRYGLENPDDIAGKVLRELGLKLEDVREEVLAVIVGALAEGMPETGGPAETVPIDSTWRAEQLERVRKIIAVHPIQIPALIGSRCSLLLQACLLAAARDESTGPLVTAKKLNQLLTLVLADETLAKNDE